MNAVVMSGTGDERVRSLYTQAVAIAGTVARRG
jgi:hypothetical protein